MGHKWTVELGLYLGLYLGLILGLISVPYVVLPYTGLFPYIP